MEACRRCILASLTLTGPGGIGKTPLALALAAEIGADFADGVLFVPLAAITNPDLVATTVARAAGAWRPAIPRCRIPWRLPCARPRRCWCWITSSTCCRPPRS